MISPNVIFAAFLSANADLFAAVASKSGPVPQIYTPRLAPNWLPKAGPAVTFFVRGGPQPSLYTPIMQPSIQVTTWAATPKLAQQVMALVYAQVHGAEPQLVDTQDGPAKILWGKAEAFPQDVVDPDTGWFTVTNFYEVAMMQ